MKNLSLVLNMVLLIAVAILYFFHFKSDSEEERVVTDSTPQNYDIVFINADTVLKHYTFFDEMQNQLKEKGEKLEKEYQNRAQGLQKELNDYQRNINNLTIGQAKAVEENLLQKQQNLRMYQESLTQELLKEEQKINKELYNKLTSFLADYSKEKGIQLVVKYNPGSDILFAKDSMDITQQVIVGLNKAHNLQKKETQDTTSVD